MRSSRFGLIALVLVVPLALLLRPRNVSTAAPQPLDRQVEVAWLRAHFDSVDAELRHNSPIQLTPAQRLARVRLIGWLREYREAGAFPRNDRFPKKAMPFFRDSRGVLCAMAYLIERSGRRDLVDRVVLTRNNAFIPGLAGDRGLRAWLDSVGFSVAEAARVQPTYGGPPPTIPQDKAVSANYALTSILVSGTSLTTIGLNVITPTKASGWAGLIAGTVGIIAGAVNLDGTDGTTKVAAANMIVGTGALAVGLYRLLRPRAARPVERLSLQSASSNAHVAIAPVVIPTSRSPRLGLILRTSF